MNILKQILAKKYEAINQLEDFTSRDLPINKCSFKKAITQHQNDTVSIIAEIKKASPSRGLIAEVDVVAQANHYENAGAQAISCLTDEPFFRGKISDLRAVSSAVSVPVIRKDFIFTKNQIAEARFFGVSAFLLMTRVMSETSASLEELIAYGTSLGMDALVEIEDAEDIPLVIAAGAEIIGVNSRNFRENSLPIESHRLTDVLPKIPTGIVRVAESGISKVADIQPLTGLADAVLIGTTLMTANTSTLPTLITSFQKPHA